jgi:opacity protein-like surface antigen
MTMKKYIVLVIGVLFATSVNAQFFVEGYAKYSIPSNSIAASDDLVELVDFDGNSFFVKEKDLFTALADPQWGGGVALRYAKNNLSVGLDLSYVEYKSGTPLLRISSFQIATTADYYWDLGGFHPYVGGELGMFSFSAQFVQTEEGDQLAQDLTKTRFGVGPRAGFVYNLGDTPWGIRLGGRYVFNIDFPFAEATIGVEYNLGDF